MCENPTTSGNNVVEVKPVRWKKQINGNYQVRKKKLLQAINLINKYTKFRGLEKSQARKANNSKLCLPRRP